MIMSPIPPTSLRDVRHPTGAPDGEEKADSDFREEIEEGVDTLAKLSFDLFAGALKQVEGDARGVSVFKLDYAFAHSGHFLGGQQTHSVD